MTDIEEALEKYDKGEISTERLAEELGVNYFVLHGALRRGCQLFEPQPDEYDPQASEFGWFLKHGWIPPEEAKAKDKECQERVERMLNQMALERCDPDVMPYFEDYYWLPKSVMQSLKKQEGVKG